MDVLRHIKLLSVVAEDVIPVGHARLAAALFYRSKVVAIGYNQYKSHPFAAKYSKNPDAIYLHAEADAINKAKKKLTEQELKKCTLIVTRVKQNVHKKLEIGIAKPCSGCQQCIEDHGIKTVIYTEDSSFKKIKFTTEISDD